MASPRVTVGQRRGHDFGSLRCCARGPLTKLGFGACLLDAVLAVRLEGVDVAADALVVVLLAGRVLLDGRVDALGGAGGDVVLNARGAHCGDSERRREQIGTERSHVDGLSEC